MLSSHKSHFYHRTRINGVLHNSYEAYLIRLRGGRSRALGVPDDFATPAADLV